MAFNAVYDVGKWIFVGLWLAGNAILFGYAFWEYYTLEEFYYLRSITGVTIAFSRATAASLNLNCCLVLLPVCRNIISRIRGSCPVGRTMVWRHLDKNLTFHKMCGYTICFWTVVHFIGHTFNIERFIYAQALPDVPIDLRHELSELPVTQNGSWVNPVRSNNTNAMYQLVTIIPGWTGVIATLCLIVMVASSTEFIRRNYFEIFWYTHHLFVLFFVVILIHGTGGIVRKQKNMEQHHHYNCENQCVNWTKVPECPVPEFQGKEAETWMWVIGPMFLYAIERLIRLVRRFQKVELIKVVEHPSRVIELQMRKSGFSAKAGQYIFINCPSIARFQWHPFTLTSAPEDGYFSVHIRQEGDWTNALAKECHCNSRLDNKVDISHLPRLAVDGPFGTCSEDVFRYRVAVLVGAGIGVTPFASILKHISHKHSEPGESSPLMKVYFFWVCSDTTSFEWFVKVLESLEEQMEVKGTQHFIDIKMHWTRGWNEEQRDRIIHAISDPRDPITQLRNRTNFGRPNWDQEFDNIAQNHPGEKIGVFFCGPKEMSKRLHEISIRHSTLNGSRFIYNKENF